MKEGLLDQAEIVADDEHVGLGILEISIDVHERTKHVGPDRRRQTAIEAAHGCGAAIEFHA